MDQKTDNNSNVIKLESENDSSVHPDMMIELASNVEFQSDPLETKKHFASNKSLLKEAKKKQDEEYNIEIQKQRYTRLMHLLNKSKFFTSHVINTIENEEKKTEKKLKRKKGKENSVDNDENVPPKKKTRGEQGNKYNVEDLSINMKKQIQTIKNEKSLDEEKTKLDFSNDSDNDTPNATVNNVFVAPKYFCGQLRNYQQKGLEWLKVLYKNGLGGILADEMGLGKTIQVIALLCHHIETKQPGPYLIVVPLSTITNWLLEFEKFAPELPVVVLHGTLAERVEQKKKILCTRYITDNFKTKPIVITSYETTLVEEKFLRTQKWKYIIVDEGQRLKNYKCILLRVLKNLSSMNRLLLTGTPLQNDLSELWSLLNFLLPDIFNDLDTFKSWFDPKELQHQEGTEKFLKQEEEKQVLSSLREILRPFMLRRIKTDVCSDIPPKKEIIVYAPLTKFQYDLYNAVLNYDLEMLSKIENPPTILSTVNGQRPKRQCVLRKEWQKRREQDINNSENEKLQESNTTDTQEQTDLSMWKQYADVTERNINFFINLKLGNRVMMYRKIVNHPYLIHWPLDSTGLPQIDDDLIKNSGKLLVLDAMLAELKKRGHKVLLFSTMTLILDIIEDYLTLRDYNYVRLDGNSKIKTRQEHISKFNNDPDMFLFLISTRAGGVGINLASADTIIIYDSDWNPQVDLQAAARCHRIGQTKPVVVYKLCTKGTIDEIIINRASAKRVLEKFVISKGAKCITKDSLLELKNIISSKDYKVVTSEKKVFTKMELNKLLDRSDLMISNDNTLKKKEK